VIETCIGSLKAGFVTERSELGSCRGFRFQYPILNDWLMIETFIASLAWDRTCDDTAGGREGGRFMQKELKGGKEGGRLMQKRGKEGRRFMQKPSTRATCEEASVAARRRRRWWWW